jgi:hypothetical protein
VLAQFGTHVKFVGERLLAALEELCRGNPQCVVELLRRAKAASPPVLVFTSLVASEHDNAASGSQGIYEGKVAYSFVFIVVVVVVVVVDVVAVVIRVTSTLVDLILLLLEYFCTVTFPFLR